MFTAKLRGAQLPAPPISQPLLPSYRSSLARPARPVTCYEGRGSGQTRMLHPCCSQQLGRVS